MMLIPTATLTQVSASSMIQDIILSVDGPINFPSIPASYTHLLIVAYVRQTGAITDGTLRIRFNQDNGANYQEEIGSYLNATGSAAGAVAQNQIEFGHAPGASATANYFGAATVYIPYYANTTGFKPCVGDSHVSSSAAAGSQRRSWGGGMWLSTAAINHVNIFGASGAGDMAAGSRFTLYGLQ